MSFYERHPELKKFLIPGTPFTSVWWSYDDRPYNYHHDWNTYGAACLICPEDVLGGNLIVKNPEGTKTYSIHMMKGKIICGRWALSQHCNVPVLEAKKRYSMVFYCDSRPMLGKQYKPCSLSHPTEESIHSRFVKNAAINSTTIESDDDDHNHVSENHLQNMNQAALDYDGFVPPDLVAAMAQAAGQGRLCGGR